MKDLKFTIKGSFPPAEAAEKLAKPIVAAAADIQKTGIRIGIIGSAAIAAPHLLEIVAKLSEIQEVKMVEIIKHESCGPTVCFDGISMTEEARIQFKRFSEAAIQGATAGSLLRKTLDEIQPSIPKKKKRRKKYWQRPVFGENE